MRKGSNFDTGKSEPLSELVPFTCAVADAEPAFDESSVGVWFVLRMEFRWEEFETDRRLVFGDAERGLFASLLRFDMPFGLRVVVVGEADLRCSGVPVPLSNLLALTEEVWLVGGGFEAVLPEEERLDGSSVSAA